MSAKVKINDLTLAGSISDTMQLETDIAGTIANKITIAQLNTYISNSAKSLANNHIFVGNVSNMATDVAMSGEASIINTGAITLSNAAVISKVLTGYAKGTGSTQTISATDSILSAIQKVDGNNMWTYNAVTGDIYNSTIGGRFGFGAIVSSYTNYTQMIAIFQAKVGERCGMLLNANPGETIDLMFDDDGSGNRAGGITYTPSTGIGQLWAISSSDTALEWNQYTCDIVSANGLRIKKGSFYGTLIPTTLTTGQTWTFQNASGTVAFLTDIPAGAGIWADYTTYISSVNNRAIVNSSYLELDIASASLILGTQDAYGRYQIWNYLPNSIIRCGSLSSDGDAPGNISSEGAIWYGQNAQLDPMTGTEFAYTRIKPRRIGIYNAKGSGFTGYLFKCDVETNEFYLKNNAGTTTVNIDRSTGQTTLSNLSASSLIGANASKVLVSITDLPNGTTATTQSANDNSTKVATTAYVDAAAITGSYGSFVTPPITPTTTGIKGQWSYDSGYIYRCVATNTWVRNVVATSW